MHLGMNRLQLWLLEYCLDNLMPKSVLCAHREPYLVDQLSNNQLLDRRFDSQTGQQITIEMQHYNRCSNSKCELSFRIQPANGHLQCYQQTDFADISAAGVAVTILYQHGEFS